MLLSVVERIVLMGVIPQESNYLNFKILTALRTDLSFSEKEMKDYKIAELKNPKDPNQTQVVWDTKKEKKKDVTIGEKAMDIVVESLKRLDREGKINANNIPVYERFVVTLKKE
jgi:hypothetical protein